MDWSIDPIHSSKFSFAPSTVKLSLTASPCITRGRGGWLGLTPWTTCTSYPLPAFLAHSDLGHEQPRIGSASTRRASLLNSQKADRIAASPSSVGPVPDSDTRVRVYWLIGADACTRFSGCPETSQPQPVSISFDSALRTSID